MLNAGWSRPKFSVFDTEGAEPKLHLRGVFEELGKNTRFRAWDGDATPVEAPGDGAGHAPGHEGALACLVPWLQQRLRGTSLAAVGHRVVHGDAAFSGPVVVDESVPAALAALVPLASLHQPEPRAPGSGDDKRGR